MIITELINKRILIKQHTRTYGGNENIEEVKVLEVSPSNNWTKLMNSNGNKYWRKTQDISLIEVLIDLTNGKPKQ